jgi:excinuclease ABC subunit C
VLFIDGGPGQVAMAKSVLNELQIVDVLIIGVAKGPDRREGQEVLLRGDDNRSFQLPLHSAALHLIQHIRNESHRFAIAGHRNKRDKQRFESPLDDIAGIGPKRRRELLKFFGGIQGVRNASVEDLCRVEGINEKIALDIYATFHHGES